MKKNKILIVGGSSGLGLFLTNLYLKNKYKVTTLSRKINPKIHKSVMQITCDVADTAKLKITLNEFKKKKINFDIIVHNVGGSRKIHNHSASSDNYKHVWVNNLGYIIEINNFFIPYMQKKKWGRIVHVSSSAAYNFEAPVAYSSAKAALNTYVSSISRRLIKNNIVISAICPGPIELPNRYMTLAQKKNNSFWRNYKKNHLPINRLAKPDEITSVVYFLTSKVASYCSGAIWNVDGSEY